MAKKKKTLPKRRKSTKTSNKYNTYYAIVFGILFLLIGMVIFAA